MKKLILLIITIVFFVFGYLVVKGAGNTWACKNGEWIHFGNLKNEKPDKACGVVDSVKGNILVFTENYRKNCKFLNTESYSNSGLERVPLELTFMYDTLVVKLDGNKLSKLPDEFFNLTSIKELYLQYNKFQIIPPEISEFTNLEILDLSHNNILELPKEIGTLHKLRRLNLADNKIKKLPDEFFNLKDNLKNLDIVGNNFDTDYIIILQEKLPYTAINF